MIQDLELAVHAAVLIGLLPMCIWVGSRYGNAPISARAWVNRILVTASASLVTLVVPLIPYACACGPGNNPIRQVVIPAVGVAICCSMLPAGALRRRTSAGLLVVGLLLSARFNALALPHDRAECRYTGDPNYVRNSCSRDPESYGVHRLWHTAITGIFGIVRSCQDATTAPR